MYIPAYVFIPIDYKGQSACTYINSYTKICAYYIDTLIYIYINIDLNVYA